MRTFLIAVAVFLFVNVFTSSRLLAQQKDSVMLSEVDSLSRLNGPPHDSLFFGTMKKEQDPTLVNPIDSIIKATPAKDLSKVSTQKALKDTSFTIVKNKKHEKWSRPKKTMVLAMLMPGAGQVYNQKYWKLPILYAGVGAVVYFLYTNQKTYNELKGAYTYYNTMLTANHAFSFSFPSSNTGNTYTSVNQLATDRDTYRRYRDMSIAGAAVLYVISVLDAYVDAHLRTFDLNPDLSVSINPLFYKNNTTFVTGISLNFNFKNNRIRSNQLSRKYF